MNRYLLEIGVEEFPAKYISSTKGQFREKFEKVLDENEIKYDKISINTTPRRFSILLNGLIKDESDRVEKVKGPSKDIALDKENKPSKALEGFMRGKNLNIEDIFFEDLNGKEYAFANVKVKTKTIAEIISEEVPKIIRGISNPKSMRWAGKNLRFLRPIRWFLSLYNDEILTFDLEGIKVSNITKGHRFLGKSEIVIDKIDEYEKKLEENFVIIDEKKRFDMILRGINRLAKAKGGNVLLDDDLLDEVVHIIEYPTAFIGSIELEYLDLPKEVVITPMKDHQRYFPVVKDDGDLMPFFISVRNGDDKGIENVIEGNEKVLTARLEDAKFFYKQDVKAETSTWKEKLATVSFHENLGSLSDKEDRLVKIVEVIGNTMDVGESTLADAKRAAEISKLDLVSKMVIEFTELEGTMGRIYAIEKGENISVAKAIEEQYMPRKSGGDLPKTTAGILLSLADKIDTIVGLYADGIEVTGSQDPYALRRAALGIINILLENQINLSLTEIFKASLVTYVDQFQLVFDYNEVNLKIEEFIKNRLKNKLIDDGYRYDLVDACINTTDSSVVSMDRRVKFMDKFINEDDRANYFLTSSIRLDNMAKNIDLPNIDKDLLGDEDKLIYDLSKKSDEIGIYIDRGELEEAVDMLFPIFDELNKYLDATKVITEDEAKTANRLSILARIAENVRKLYNPGTVVRE